MEAGDMEAGDNGECSVMNIRQRMYAAVCGVLLALTSSISHAQTVFVIDELQLGLHTERQITSPIAGMIDSGTELEVLEREGNFVRVKTKDGREGWVDGAYIASARPVAARLKAIITSNEALRAELSTLRSEAERLKSDLLDSGETRKRQIAAITHALEAAIEAKDAQINALSQPRGTQHTSGQHTSGGEQAGQLQAEIERLRAQVSELRAASATHTNAPIPSDALREMQHLAEENRSLKSELTAARAAARDLRARLTAATPSPPPPPPTLHDWNARLQSLTAYDIAAIGFTILLLFVLGVQFESYMVRRRHGGFRL